jgi:hypothetical protein
LQQTRSTQNPDAHWLAAAQVLPNPSLGLQTPPEQNSSASQLASVVQSPRQAVAPHVKGAQSCSWRGPHAPSPAQVRSSVATPLPQAAASQTVSVPG